MSTYGYVYVVLNTQNGKAYIGQTTRSVDVRWRCHINLARNGGGYRLQQAIRKYGEGVFTLSTLTHAATQNELNLAEDYWVSVFNSVDFDSGYNSVRGGQGRNGPCAETTKQKIGAANTGNTNCLGRKISDATKQKMREAKFGKKHTEEHNAKIAEAGRGRIHSDETRKKISAGQLGNKRGPHTPEAKARISAGGKARWAKQRATVSVEFSDEAS